MPQQGKRLQDHHLLMALACGATLESAARQCGLSESTARRRLQEPAFAKKLQEVRAGMIERTAATLTAAGGEAVKTLVSLLAASTPPPVRLGSARSVLEMGVKYRELADMEQRLAALEQRLAESQAAEYCGASA
jgi:hypothetical protein